MDFSDASLNALNVAGLISKTKKASLQILNVLDDSIDFYHEFFKSTNNNDDKILDALANSLGRLYGLVPEVILKTGSVAANIVSHAFHQKMDLIVIGMHGTSGNREDFVGSVAYNVIKFSTTPVLIVPSGEQITSFKNVLFPIRLLAGALSPYDILCHFLVSGAHLEVLGMAHSKQEKTKLLDSLLAEIRGKLNADQVASHSSWAFGNAISDNILMAIDQFKADLLVVSSALDVTSKPFFVGPHTQKILHRARIPILCIKKPGTASFA